MRVMRRLGFASLLVVAAAALGGPAGASLGGNHGGVVAETPRIDVPRVLDGRLYDAAEVGATIVVGGSFTQIEVAGGTQTRAGLFAFDSSTGALRSGVPAIAGTVHTIEPVGGDWVVIGGSFTDVAGTFHGRLARLNVVTGAVDRAWNPNANARITATALVGDRLFVGGDFTAIDGRGRSRLAELSLATGEVDTGFDISLTGDLGNGGPVVRKLMVTADGGRLVVAHRAASVDGQVRRGAAVIELAGGSAAVSSWQTDVYPSNLSVQLHDADISPDGSFFVLANAGGDRPPSRDTLIALPTAGNGSVEPLWVSRLFDSVYAVAVSDAAVYAGGHFCWVEGPLASDPWPGPVGTDHSCHSDRNAGQFQPETVYRDQIAAFGLADGKALSWDPGAGGFNGVRMLEVTPSALFGGSDGTRWGGVDVGRFAAFESGVAPPPPPPPPPGGCTAETAGNDVVLTWTDDGGFHVVRRNERWLSSPGTDTSTYTDTNAPTGATYVIRTWSGGTSTDRTCS